MYNIKYKCLTIIYVYQFSQLFFEHTSSENKNAYFIKL